LLTLDLAEGARTAVLEGDRLLLQMRKPHERARARVELIRWLKEHALETLVPRVAHYAALLGLPEPRVTVSNARTQWGVCTQDGRIRLSWRLVHVQPTLADYVVAHEVAHLVELNHSARFWKVVETLYPDCRAARHDLDLAAAALPII
jgi:predicted metal-dependent hydrolase